MPKLQIDFSKTVMYKIVCNDLSITDCYVGHTTNFISRKSCHKKRCDIKNERHSDFKIYKFIRENGGWENWRMVEIEKFPCKDFNEASSRERYWYELLKPTLNGNVPNRSVEEWYEDNREKILLKTKIYNDNNKEKRKEYYKQKKLAKQAEQEI
jgi:hypothetical protein